MSVKAAVTPIAIQEVTYAATAIDGNMSTSAQTITVKGVPKDALCKVEALELETGVYIISSRVKLKDTVEIVFFNTTGDVVTPASQKYKVIVF